MCGEQFHTQGATGQIEVNRSPLRNRRGDGTAVCPAGGCQWIVSDGMLRTELTRLLGLQYPIVQAPMAAGPTTPELVAEVSAGGGFGVYAGSGVPPHLLADSISVIRARTTASFGVNFLIALRKPAETSS